MALTKEQFEHRYGKCKNGITQDEYSILMRIVDVHNDYSKLEQTHPSDLPEWVNAIHRLQELIAMRVVRRDYPGIFPKLYGT